MSQQFANHRIGRIALHTLCALRDHKWAWHLLGIKREFARITPAWTSAKLSR